MLVAGTEVKWWTSLKLSNATNDGFEIDEHKGTPCAPVLKSPKSFIRLLSSNVDQADFKLTNPHKFYNDLVETCTAELKYPWSLPQLIIDLYISLLLAEMPPTTWLPLGQHMHALVRAPVEGSAGLQLPFQHAERNWKKRKGTGAGSKTHHVCKSVHSKLAVWFE